ncbi:TPA: hypothetical protein ACGXKU_006454 [Bacillus cereus]
MTLTFHIGGVEVFLLCENYVGGVDMTLTFHNGDIYVKGKLVENDKEVVDGMREFLRLSR